MVAEDVPDNARDYLKNHITPDPLSVFFSTGEQSVRHDLISRGKNLYFAINRIGFVVKNS